MSESSSINDGKKPGPSGAASNAATVTTSAGTVPSAFSIDGLLGLKQREAADNKEENKVGNTAATSPGQTSQPMAHQTSATHLVYSAAAASTMIPSSSLHGALWSSHPASIAAFRCKYMQANYF